MQAPRPTSTSRTPTRRWRATARARGAGIPLATAPRGSPNPGRVLAAPSADGGATGPAPQHSEPSNWSGNDSPTTAPDGAGPWMIAGSASDGDYQNRRLRLARS